MKVPRFNLVRKPKIQGHNRKIIVLRLGVFFKFFEQRVGVIRLWLFHLPLQLRGSKHVRLLAGK